MLSRRFVALLLVAVLGLAAVVVLRQGDDGIAPPAVLPATSSPAPPTATRPVGDATTAPPADGDTLEAVQTLKRLCDRIDEGDLRAARRLLAGPWVWPQRELRVIARLGLLSARVQGGRSAGDVVLMARLRAGLRGPSPLHDGVNTLFFTLGRDGTTGGWLVTAVASSP